MAVPFAHAQPSASDRRWLDHVLITDHDRHSFDIELDHEFGEGFTDGLWDSPLQSDHRMLWSLRARIARRLVNERSRAPPSSRRFVKRPPRDLDPPSPPAPPVF